MLRPARGGRHFASPRWRRPSRLATVPGRAGAPLPSTSEPPLISRSTASGPLIGPWPSLAVHRGHAAQSNRPMNGDGPVGAVILAAGMSRRFGSPKQLVVVDGRTAARARGRRRAGGRPRPDRGGRAGLAVAPGARLMTMRLRWIRNPFPERGMSLSLRLGFGALGDGRSAAVILLGDQPRRAAIDDRRRPRRARRAPGRRRRGGRHPGPAGPRRAQPLPPGRGLSGDIGLRDLARREPGPRAGGAGERPRRRTSTRPRTLSRVVGP